MMSNDFLLHLVCLVRPFLLSPSQQNPLYWARVFSPTSCNCPQCREVLLGVIKEIVMNNGCIQGGHMLILNLILAIILLLPFSVTFWHIFSNGNISAKSNWIFTKLSRKLPDGILRWPKIAKLIQNLYNSSLGPSTSPSMTVILVKLHFC